MGLHGDELVSWNVYPWYINASPSAAQRAAGLDVLARFVDLLPDATALVLGGNVARKAWPLFEARFPDPAGRFRAFPTFHTSRRGITNGGRQTKAEGVEHVTATLAAVRDHIRT